MEELSPIASLHGSQSRPRTFLALVSGYRNHTCMRKWHMSAALDCSPLALQDCPEEGTQQFLRWRTIMQVALYITCCKSELDKLLLPVPDCRGRAGMPFDGRPRLMLFQQGLAQPHKLLLKVWHTCFGCQDQRQRSNSNILLT